MKSRLLVDAIVFIILIVMLISCGGPSAELVKSGTSRIAHAFILDGNPEICVINPDGSNFQNLTNTTAGTVNLHGHLMA